MSESNVHRVMVSTLILLVAGWILVGCQGFIPNLNYPPTEKASASVETPTWTASPAPTATPTMTNTPPAPPTLIPQMPPATRMPEKCQDDLAFVLDLNLVNTGGDTPVVASGDQIEKGWRVQNTGTCTWDSAYILAAEQNDPDWRLNTQPVELTGSVKPGDLVDFWITLDAPLFPGTYQSEWVLRNSLGEPVGGPLELKLEVAMLPTGTAQPEISLLASPLEVVLGEEARIAWSTRQAKAAFFYPSGLAWREHPVEVNGSTVVQPDRTTTYVLRVVMGDDSIETRRITIEVVPGDLPVIRSFSLNPGNVIDLGQCVDLVWRTSGRVNTVTFLRNGVYYWNTAVEDGFIWDCPSESGFYTYTLLVSGPGGVTEAERVLEVR